MRGLWEVFVWGFGVLFLPCVCVGVGGVVLCRCVCDLLIFLDTYTRIYIYIYMYAGTYRLEFNSFELRADVEHQFVLLVGYV